LRRRYAHLPRFVLQTVANRALAAEEGLLTGSRTAALGVALLSLGAVALSLTTALRYPLLTTAFVVLSLAMAGVSLWSCWVLFGARTAWSFLAIGAALGWFAEQMGSSRGWFFGSYTYTDVLGPRLGDVPLVIPCMWFGLPYIGLVLASFALWRQPGPPEGAGWKALGFTALLAAMIVTAFDLGADPYFVYQLKAWIMTEKDGGWFGETIRGFEGWMQVAFAIIVAALVLARPQLTTERGPRQRRAAWVPLAMYAFMMAFQLVEALPLALRVVAFFAMGIPLLIAAAACHRWAEGAGGASA
jgi:uncharacterized membrane protein